MVNLDTSVRTRISAANRSQAEIFQNPPCDTTIKRSDKASTARFRENDAVRLTGQPLQLSDRPCTPSNLQTLESITSQKALRSLMNWGGTYCRGRI
ncbi:hypothetical protein F2Q70_00012975 [Brassica cretica]|uniref:Uncharacterized protein n=1 Tax=Brassica cretica TaxID=69181 RepID=A0A8S9M1X7_BRACR|nr:hypothetical protein F2Q68_00006081 [Brassica cretica]KAF2611918.1 hypothetical protein F2Q70_00012975 [Brassica cretica]